MIRSSFLRWCAKCMCRLSPSTLNPDIQAPFIFWVCLAELKNWPKSSTFDHKKQPKYGEGSSSRQILLYTLCGHKIWKPGSGFLTGLEVTIYISTPPSFMNLKMSPEKKQGWRKIAASRSLPHEITEECKDKLLWPKLTSIISTFLWGSWHK